jgi:hypothetical protein
VDPEEGANKVSLTHICLRDHPFKTSACSKMTKKIEYHL